MTEMLQSNLRKAIADIVKSGAEIKRCASVIEGHTNDPAVKTAMSLIQDHINNQRGDFKIVLEYGRQQLVRKNRS